MSSNIPITSPVLRVALTNAQSLTRHIDEFRESFTNREFFHVIAVTESWLKEHVLDAAVSLNDYYMLRHDRSFAKGGGICIYIHMSLSAKCIAFSCDKRQYPEYMMVEIETGHFTKLLLCIVYRPPRIRHFNTFADAFGDVSHLFSDILVLGDFNINMSAQNNYTQMMTDFIVSQNLWLIPSNPTHHTARSHTWLDLVMVDDPE